MATKDELQKENNELKGRIAELEAAGGSVASDVVAGTDSEGEALEVGFLYLMSDAGLVLMEDCYAAEGEYVTLTEDGNVHGFKFEREASYTYGDEGLEKLEGVDTSAKDRRIEELVLDVTRLEIERNDARGAAEKMRGQLRDAGALHGSVDALKAPY
jgi:hypothetical protein